MTSKNLEDLRHEIDSLDLKLVNLLNDRANISINIGLAKKSMGESTDIHIPSRERQVYDAATKSNKGPLSNESVCAIYREIMSASLTLQKDVAIAFLGPKGTYTHQAALLKFGSGVMYSSQSTISDVFAAVENGATYGLVPFENSTFGCVQQTLDRMTTMTSVVRAMILLEIHHCLLSNATSKAEIKRVYSHPEAFGQCQKWIEVNFPRIERVTTSSTARAAELASSDPNGAAICSRVCSELYDITIFAEEIEDLKNNTTRFFILGKMLDASSGNDKTLILFTVDHRQPGALCDALNVFKLHQINLSKIESRPSGQRLWHYVFFIELEGV